MRILAITQARVGSSRLHAKILKKINNETLLDIHIQRILRSKKIWKLIVATTNEPEANAIVSITEKYDVQSFRGPLNDVLKRFYLAALSEKPDYVVRLTSDCPLIDAQLIDEVIDFAVNNVKYDYVANALNPTYPDGVDVEVLKFSALERAYREATLLSDREHVTPYIWRNSSTNGGDVFQSFSIENSQDYSLFRLTVDEQSDFEVVKHLISTLGKDKSWIDYINYLISRSDISSLNSKIKRNQGYIKSIKKD